MVVERKILFHSPFVLLYKHFNFSKKERYGDGENCRYLMIRAQKGLLRDSKGLTCVQKGLTCAQKGDWCTKKGLTGSLGDQGLIGAQKDASGSLLNKISPDW